MPITDLDRLPRAPRPVPFSLAARLRFGGTVGLIGWIFLAFGLVFLVGFATFAHPIVHAKLAFGETGIVEGRVIDWSETWSTINEQPVIATLFEYSVDGVIYEGASFAIDHAPAPGSPARVVYAVDDPRASKIEGMMIGEAPIWVLAVVLIFPVVGAMLALVRLRRGLREVRILRHGRAAQATATGHEPTGVRINDDPEYAVTFSYTDHLGRTHSVMQKTLEPEDLLDEAREPLLYLPDRPAVALLLDSVPDVLIVEADGRFRPHPPLATLGVLLPPLVAATVLVIGALVLG